MFGLSLNLGSRRPLAAALTDTEQVAALGPKVLWDTNDLTSFYSSASAEPATLATVNGQVGLLLDSAYGKTEESVAVDLTTWAKGTGWTTPSATSAACDGSQVSNSELRLDVTPGLYAYFVTFTVDSLSGGNLAVYPYSGSAKSISSTGTYTLIGAAQSGLRIFRAPAGVSCSISNVSITRIQGVHAYLAASGSRPYLRGTPTGAAVFEDDFSDGNTDGWTVNGTSLSVVSGELEIANLASGGRLAIVAFSTTSGRVYRVKAYQRPGTAVGCSMRVGSTSGGTELYSSSNSTAAINREAYFTATGSTSYLAFKNETTTTEGATTYADNIEIHDVSADAVEAPYSLHFDGTDDGMLTGSVNFSGTDAVTVCCGVRALSSAAQGMLVELTTNSGTSAGFSVQVPGSAFNNIVTTSRGSATSTSTESSRTAPYSAGITLLADISADQNTIRVDGVEEATSATDQGTGNYSNAALYIGRRAGTSLPYNGLLGRTAIFGSILTGANLALVETWADAGKPT